MRRSLGVLRSRSDAQSGLLQDPGRKQHVVCARGRTDHSRDVLDLVPDLIPRLAVHHGEQVVWPKRQMPRAFITMGDLLQRADPDAYPGNRLIGDVPHRHAIGREAKRVVIRDRADASNRARVEQSSQAGDDFGLIEPEFLGDRPVGLSHERKAGLGNRHDLAVDGIEHHDTSIRKPTKNS